MVNYVVVSVRLARREARYRNAYNWTLKSVVVYSRPLGRNLFLQEEKRDFNELTEPRVRNRVLKYLGCLSRYLSSFSVSTSKRFRTNSSLFHVTEKSFQSRKPFVVDTFHLIFIFTLIKTNARKFLPCVFISTFSQIIQMQMQISLLEKNEFVVPRVPIFVSATFSINETNSSSLSADRITLITPVHWKSGSSGNKAHPSTFTSGNAYRVGRRGCPNYLRLGETPSCLHVNTFITTQLFHKISHRPSPVRYT